MAPVENKPIKDREALGREEILTAVLRLRALGLTHEEIGAVFSHCYIDIFKLDFGIPLDAIPTGFNGANKAVAAAPSSIVPPPSGSGTPAATPNTEVPNPTTPGSGGTASIGVTEKISESAAAAASKVGDEIAKQFNLVEKQQETATTTTATDTTKTETAVEVVTKTEAVAKAKVTATKTENIKLTSETVAAATVPALCKNCGNRPDKPKERKVLFMTECGGVYDNEDWDEDAIVEGPKGWGYGPPEYF